MTEEEFQSKMSWMIGFCEGMGWNDTAESLRNRLDMESKREPEPEPENDDVRTGVGHIQNSNAGYLSKSHRAPRTLGFTND